jgi:hypothetical protein
MTKKNSPIRSSLIQYPRSIASTVSLIRIASSVLHSDSYDSESGEF